MEYDVVYGEDYFDLIQKVNHRLQEEKNWQLQGGIAIAASGDCYQALVKTSPIRVEQHVQTNEKFADYISEAAKQRTIQVSNRRRTTSDGEA